MSEELAEAIASGYFTRCMNAACRIDEIADIGNHFRITFSILEQDARDRVFAYGCRVVVEKQSRLLYSPRPRTQRSDIDEFPTTKHLMGVYDHFQEHDDG